VRLTLIQDMGEVQRHVSLAHLFTATSTVLTHPSWGRKPILLSAVVVFLVSSIICALAVDMKMLIAGRALQGAAGGGLIMMVNVVISDIFSMRYDLHLFLFLLSG
jgi:MFS family permease